MPHRSGLTGERLYAIWRNIANHTFALSRLAPWESIGAKHKRAWCEFADRLNEIDWWAE
jgi:hypothetical protein